MAGYQFNEVAIAANRKSGSVALVEGRVFKYADYKPALAGSGAGTIDYVLHTADDIIAVTISITGTDSALTEVNIFEEPTFTGGTLIQSLNLNRNFASTGLGITNARVDPTITDDGTKVGDETLIGAGTSGKNVSIAGVEGAPFILAPNSKYLFRIINQDSGAKDYTTLFILTKIS